MILIRIFLCMIFGASVSFAADRMAAPSLSLSDNETVSSNLTSVSSNQAEEMLAKVGPAFTDGGNYSGMTLPYLLASAQPVSYPRWAVKQGKEGKIVLAIEILEDGKVGRYKAIQSTGSKMLDEAAIKALRQWQFHPAMKNGKPVKTCIEIPVTFELKK